MIHYMRLLNDPFNKIKERNETVELRLNDEKRKRVRTGDLIEFVNVNTKETIQVQVHKVNKFNTFNELYKAYDHVSMGYAENDVPNPQDMISVNHPDEIKEYGVVALEIELIESKLSVERFKAFVQEKIDSIEGDFIDIVSGDVHRALGSYPSRNHLIPSCCAAMRNLMQDQDEIVHEPPQGQGATFTVRYYKR